MTLQPHLPSNPYPLYWLRVPHSAMRELRRHGFHDGYWRDNALDVDMKVAMAFDTCMPPAGRDKHLAEWLTFVDREVSILRPGYPSLWHPGLTPADEADIRRRFAGRLVELNGETAEDVLHRLRMAEWHLGVFYHVAAIGHWREVVSEHLALLARVGLNGIYVSILGEPADRRWFEVAADGAGIRTSVQYYHSDVRMYEIPTMALVQDWCRAHSGYALYFHTKGVSGPDDQLKQNWRRLMNRYVIERWRENAELLRSRYDVVGVNWRDTPPLSHFPGNFWMATTTCIRSLEDFAKYYQNPRHNALGHEVNQHRLAAEFWIGSAARTPRVYSHVSRNERIDTQDYWIRHGDAAY